MEHYKKYHRIRGLLVEGDVFFLLFPSTIVIWVSDETEYLI